jgi:hypothetical protein
MKTDLKIMYYVHAFLLFVLASVLWGLALMYRPHLDGVAVYRMSSSMPIESMANKFSIAGHNNRSKNAFVTEAMMMPYCVFPSVYNKLQGRSTESLVSYLVTDQMLLNAIDASTTQTKWTKIDFDAWDNSPQTVASSYNLPYDGIDPNRALNPQYFSPVCRCINQVLDIYSNNKGTFDSTTESLKACMATRHIIQRQTLVGNDDPSNSDITARKYISRHALLFNLCTAVIFSMLYNRIDFNEGGNTVEFYTKQWPVFLGLLISFIICFVSQSFSSASVAAANSMLFSCLVYLPAAIIFFAVEWMWSHVAKGTDVRRQTYLHPYSFYIILVNLHVLALIENGVFTLEIIQTFILLANITALSYTAIIFIAHGKLWQQAGEKKRNLAELTGYILILFLIGLTNVFHYIPVHPINSELNYLWMLHMVFVMFCFTQVVFLEHLMGEDMEEVTEESEDIQVITTSGQNTVAPSKSQPMHNYLNPQTKKLKFTNSVHLLNLGHTVIIVLVMLHFAKELHYSWYGSLSFVETGGKLDRHVNFELTELLGTASYNNVGTSTGKFFASS